MRNERLRALLLERGETPDKLAEAVQVDAKTVERWITKGRIPYRRHRFEVAAFLGVDESYIWPDALGRDEVAAVSESEVVAVYPHRSEVPRDVWGHLFSAGRTGDRRAGVLRAVPVRGRGHPEDLQGQGRGRASGCGSCSVTRTARSWPSAAKTRASAMPWPPRSATRWRCTGRCGRWRAWSSGCTARCCTTRSTAPMTRCWSTPTCYGVTAAQRPGLAPAQAPRRRAGQLVHRQLRAGLGNGHAVGRGLAGVARRIDYYDDPAAPKANSLVPSVNVVVTNAAGEVLLIRRSDNDNWAVPGGAIDLGESMVQAAVRETREETGIDCEVTGLVGIYTDPRHVILYTSNGEARQEFSIVLTARATGGEPTRSEREQRGPVGPARGPRRLSDGSLDAAAHRALPRADAATPYLG